MSEAVVETPAQAAALSGGAAIVLGPLREFLDAVGIGAGALRVEPIGEGHSNLTFLVVRGDQRVILRRPPRGEIAASANDVLRESRVLEAVARTGVPVPKVLASCEDENVIGAPFFVMSYVASAAINDALPAALDIPDAAERVVAELVGTLAELHAADLEGTGLSGFRKPSGYLDRQLRRFEALLEENATRPLPDLEYVDDWLAGNLPDSAATTFVHGDYRLGNWTCPVSVDTLRLGIKPLFLVDL